MKNCLYHEKFVDHDVLCIYIYTYTCNPTIDKNFMMPFVMPIVVRSNSIEFV